MDTTNLVRSINGLLQSSRLDGLISLQPSTRRQRILIVWTTPRWPSICRRAW